MSVVVSIISWVLSVGLVLSLLIAIGLIIYIRWDYGVLESLGLPVVKPHFLLGSNHNASEIIFHLEDLKRVKKYGLVYGVYEGRKPQVYVCDPELVRIIMMRDFEYFRNHGDFDFGHPLINEVLDFLKDDTWKTVRSALTPSFTSGKIKQMGETVYDLADDYVTALLKEKEEDRFKFDFRSYAPPLIIEIIGKCFCGIQVANARDPNNKYIQNMKIAMGGDFMSFDWKTLLLPNVLPFIVKFFPVFPNESMNVFDAMMKEILDGRSKSGIQKNDMVNTLLEMRSKCSTSEYKRLGITENTVIAQGFEFFLASFEGIRSALTFLIYYLALNPKLQERMLREIDDSLKTNSGKITHETIADMHFLTACLTETVRLNPSFFRLERVCGRDWEYNGIKIKKGLSVIFPIYALHRNEVYTEPEIFDPDRFMPENKGKLDPFAFCGFGHGPRNCIGQRFVMDMMKIVVARYFQDFRVEKREDTILKLQPGNPFMLQHDPIYVDFIKRKQK